MNRAKWVTDERLRLLRRHYPTLMPGRQLYEMICRTEGAPPPKWSAVSNYAYTTLGLRRPANYDRSAAAANARPTWKPEPRKSGGILHVTPTFLEAWARDRGLSVDIEAINARQVSKGLPRFEVTRL